MKAGDRVRVIATGEEGQLITTRQYNAMSNGNLTPRRWAWTKWVRFDRHSNDRPIVVGHTQGELEVL